MINEISHFTKPNYAGYFITYNYAYTDIYIYIYINIYIYI